MLKRMDADQDIARKESHLSNDAMRVARFAGWGAVLVVLILAAYGVWGHIRRSNAAVETLMQADNLVPIVRTSEV